MTMRKKNVVSFLLILTLVITSVVLINPPNKIYAAKSKKIKIAFNTNGGNSLAKLSQIKNVTKGKKLGRLPKATRKGYSFKGWYTKKSKGKKISKNTKVSKNTTYYAHWTAKKYTIKFDLNGGETINFKTKKVKYGSKYGNLPTPTREDNIFCGWMTGKMRGYMITPGSINTVAANDTLYAQWVSEPDRYCLFTIRCGTIVSATKKGKGFDKGMMDDQLAEQISYPIGTVVTIKANEKEYGTFEKWSIHNYMEGNGLSFAPGYDDSTAVTKVVISPLYPDVFSIEIKALFEQKDE